MKSLSPEQRRVVQQSTGHLLVRAAPGSGKTETLIHCAVHLIEERLARPEQMRLLTLGRPASEDLRHRVQRINALRDAKVGTLHSLCHAFLGDIDVRDDDPQDKAFALNLQGLRVPPDLAALLHLQAGEFTTAGMDKPAMTNLTDSMKSPAPAGRLTQTSVLLWTLKLLHDPPPRMQHLLDGIKVIMVDEAQDLSPLEWSIILRICQKPSPLGPRHLIAFGDPYQAINTFQGAVPDFIEFLMHHPVRLRQTLSQENLNLTWRCRGEVVLLASAFVREMRRASQPVVPMRGFGGHVSDPQTFEEEMALQGALRTLTEKALERGNDIAVLTATNKTVDLIRMLLPGAQTVKERNSGASPEEERLAAALRCAYGLSQPGEGHPLLQDGLNLVSSRITRAQRQKIHAAWKFGQPSPDPGLAALEVKLRQALEQGLTSLELLNCLGWSATDPHLRSLLDEYPNPARLLAALHARRPQHSDRPKVYVGTIHAAKGQEWSEVALLFDVSQVRWSFEQAYVGVTRARDHLHLLQYGRGKVPDLLRIAQATAEERQHLADMFAGEGDPPASQLEQALGHPVVGPYLIGHWPRLVTPELLQRWKTILGAVAPATWSAAEQPTDHRPDESWRQRVTILADYAGVDVQ